MKSLTINCSKQYDIIIGSDLLYRAGRSISQVLAPCRICIVSDETVRALYGGAQSALYQSLLSAGFDVYEYTFAPGEKSKTLQTAASILDFLAANRFSRDDALLALGGGVTGDLTGFVASTYMRGIRFVQMPTTLLACIDASIGGKTAVDLPAGKNLAGTFWHPEMVLVDTDVFTTLSDDLWRDGLAEMVKAGMIGDPSIIRDLTDHDIRAMDREALTDLLLRALSVKADIVAADEREQGLRQLLNFGHTVGHAFEQCSGYDVSHGQAVAAGMLIEAAAAECKGWASKGNAGLLKNLLTKLGFPVETMLQKADNLGYAPLAKAALGDKKAHGDAVTIAYPMRPGLCECKPLPTSEMEDFIKTGAAAL